MTRRAPRRTTTPENVSEIIASLQKGARTIQDLLDMTEASEQTVRRWIEGFHGSGLVRIAEYIPRCVDGKHVSGRRRIRWEWQIAPFEKPDVKP